MEETEQACDRGDCQHESHRIRAIAAHIDAAANILYDFRLLPGVQDDRIKLYAVCHRLNKLADSIQHKAT